MPRLSKNKGECLIDEIAKDVRANMICAQWDGEASVSLNDRQCSNCQWFKKEK